jgi:ABC-type polar amino acid transport system ATPase subunit
MPAPESFSRGAAPVLVARGLRAARLPAGIALASPALDLELEAGAICCLIGPQDTGKTAWLRTLAAVEPPAAGTLTIVGLDARPADERAWRRLRARAGYVGESTPLLSVQNALSNVMLGAQYHNLAGGTELRRRALAWLDRLGWDGPLDRLPAHLSRHQRCVLMLARCLLLEPAVMFVNEPFHLTDANSWRELARIFLMLAREHGIAQVMLTHDLPFVQRNAGRILFTGAQGIRAFAGWAAFAACGDAEVDAFCQTADLAFSGA